MKKKYNKNSIKKEKLHSNIIVTGGHGIGKTILVNLILKKYNYDIRILKFSRVKNNIKNNINSILKNNNILSNIKGKKNTKIVLVIDELETITSNADKSCILNLQKKMNQIGIFLLYLYQITDIIKFYQILKKFN